MEKEEMEDKERVKKCPACLCEPATMNEKGECEFCKRILNLRMALSIKGVGVK